MADLTRVFSRHNADKGQTEWFFMAREGMNGPFATEALAQAALGQYIEYCMFDANRVFFQKDPETGETNWFFIARDGIEGPYDSEATAQEALGHYVESKKQEDAQA